MRDKYKTLEELSEGRGERRARGTRGEREIGRREREDSGEGVWGRGRVGEKRGK